MLNLGIRLERARQEHCFPPNYVADKLGISASDVIAAEQGFRAIPDRELSAYSRFYRIPEGDLLGDNAEVLPVIKSGEVSEEYRRAVLNLAKFKRQTLGSSPSVGGV